MSSCTLAVLARVGPPGLIVGPMVLDDEDTYNWTPTGRRTRPALGLLTRSRSNRRTLVAAVQGAGSGQELRAT